MGRYPFSVPGTTYIAYLAPSGDTTGVTDAANIMAAVSTVPALGGVIRLAATGTWYIECGQVIINRSGLYIDAAGCYISAVGAGDVFRMYDSSSLTARTVWGGGILGMPTVDGASTTGNSCGWHAGDIPQLASFVQCQNFTAGTTSKGAWLDNQWYWTEQAYGRIVAKSCRTHVQFDNSTGDTNPDATGSFDRLAIDIYINQNGDGDGVTWANGAFAQNYYLGIWGNFKYSSSAYTVLRMTGQNSYNASYLGVGGGDGGRGLYIGVECDGTGVTQPTTIQFESSPFTYVNSSGNLSFDGFAQSNNSGGHFQLAGSVVGDASLPTLLTLTSPAQGQTLTGNNQEIYIQWYGNIVLTLGASYTGAILQAGGFDGQRVTLINANAYSLTFAASGTSNVADGTSDVIAANTAATYVWAAGPALWYRSV